MSLFIGNLNRIITENDLSETFSKYGKCTIFYKGFFAFIEFESKKDAEIAKTELNEKLIKNQKLLIDWSRSKKPTETHNKIQKMKCFNCNKIGHYSRNCPRSLSRSHSRKKYYYRKSISRSRSRNYRRKSPNFSRSVSRSPKRNYYGKYNRNYEYKKRYEKKYFNNSRRRRDSRSNGKISRSWSKDRGKRFGRDSLDKKEVKKISDNENKKKEDEKKNEF